MKTKYDFEFSNDIIHQNTIRLINQLWKLIPMRENGENWKKQLTTVINEIAGLKEIFLSDPHFLQILSKLEGLQVVESEFDEYRKVVFESISLLQEFSKRG